MIHSEDCSLGIILLPLLELQAASRRVFTVGSRPVPLNHILVHILVGLFLSFKLRGYAALTCFQLVGQFDFSN